MAAFLLDTDTSVDLISGTAPAADWMLGQRVSISVITAYELAVGAEKCRSEKSRSETIGFLEAIEILEFDDMAARESAQVRAELEAEGLGIGPYDTLIAGHCRILKRILVTNNLREFGRVHGLQCRSGEG